MNQTILTPKSLSPILKWAGGKTQIMPQILANLPPQWDKTKDWYHEPFLGGGAVLLNLMPSYAIAGDINGELVNFYDVVKKQPEILRSILWAKGGFGYSEDAYYAVRDLDRDKNFKNFTEGWRAARFLYLNKHGYRGLCRYNSKGEFNIPYGNYKSVEYDFENIAAVSNYLVNSSVRIAEDHWKDALLCVGKGEFAYLDPPYDPLSPTSSFTGYTSHGFSRDDQLALKLACDQLSKDGAYFMQSNAATPFILDLYRDYKQVIIPVKRQINNKEKTRESVNEVLIMNY
jgi:DNA adenine methylase